MHESPNMSRRQSLSDNQSLNFPDCSEPRTPVFNRMLILCSNEEFKQATEVISNCQTLLDGDESSIWAGVVKLMQMLRHEDPFVAYEAAASLKSYINRDFWHYIVEYLSIGTPYPSIDNSRVLEILHFVLKFVRTQIKRDTLSTSQKDLYATHLRKLCLYLKIPSQHDIAWFDSVRQFAVEHLVVTIDILKLKSTIQNPQIPHNSLPLQDNKEINGLYRLSDYIAPLCNADILKISDCMDSGDITLIRKATELLWMNLEDTSHNKVPETIKLSLDCAKAYLFRAFQSLEDADELFAFNTTEFYYSEITANVCIDRETLKRATKICLKAFHAATNMMDYQSDCYISTLTAIEDNVKAISNTIADCCAQLGKSVSADFFFNICGNEDNDIIYILDILLKLAKSKTHFNKSKGCIAIKNLHSQILAIVDPIDSSRGFKHAELFLYFLFRIGLDHTTLLDMLMSHGSQFRDYFSNMLVYIIEDTKDFYEACARAAAPLLLTDESDEELDEETVAADHMVDIVIEIFEELIKLLIMSQDSNFKMIIPNLQAGISALKNC